MSGTGPIKSLEEASTRFESLVHFVKGGDRFDETSTKQACRLISNLTPGFKTFFNTGQILHELVPKQNPSPQGFIEHFIHLLTCSNPDIASVSFNLLYGAVITSSPSLRFELAGTKLFSFIPPSFYEPDILLNSSRGMRMMHIIFELLLSSTQPVISEITNNTQIGSETIRQTVYNCMIQPLQPFWSHLTQYVPRIPDQKLGRDFHWILGTVIRSAPFHIATADFVMKSDICFVFMICPLFFVTDSLNVDLIGQLIEALRDWKDADTDVRNRSKTILCRLGEEGLSDELELHSRLASVDWKVHRGIYIAAKLIHLFGGNDAFLM
ncbi:hypothetical protein BLNAU_8114 [Blattamonas nauphoetae]|uniref:Uncharacterized protein n=1 Tax=Blattamonas nauphoetae TaxID=2049346 RepID=A0ABQ9XZ96_9EUKA|nr:hypothetical protein BLNAU_8114 [Blattamonas nauphoetae]